MCNYEYKNYSLNEKNYRCQLSETVENLPIDSEGKCIFHSTEIEWKINHDFTGYLRRYLEGFHQSEKKPDLREVHFVASKGKILIEYIDILSGAILEGSEFHASIEMKGKKRYKTFHGALQFSSCIFHHDVIFSYCKFKHEVEFSNIKMISNYGKDLNLRIENCDFEHYFEFIYQEDFTSHLSITDNHFKEQVLFQGIKKQENEFDIIGNIFEEDFTFSDSEIDTLVINFSDNTFNGDAEFKELELKGIILFNQPKVERKLMFSGSTERKIFYGRTEFKIHPKDIKGQIIFQHTQLMVFDRSDLEELKKMEKLGEGENKKVQIGAGCIKYRWQTPPKTLKMGVRQSYIIEDLTRTFTSFLSNSVQKNIGVEIIDRTSREITFFYFSDENLSDQEFENLFIKGQQEFFEIMYNTQKLTTQQHTEEENMNFIHTRLKQINVISSILMELQRGNWQLSDSKGLLESLALDHQDILSYEGFDQTLRKMTNKELVETAKTANVPLNILQISIGKHISHIQNMNGNIIEQKD